jgi:hypothetical protein
MNVAVRTEAQGLSFALPVKILKQSLNQWKISKNKKMR